MGKPQGRVKVGEKAALPPAVRKASGFPAMLAPPLLPPLGWKAQPSSRAGGAGRDTSLTERRRSCENIEFGIFRARVSSYLQAGKVVFLNIFTASKPFRTAGGRAALGCYLSGTLTQPCSRPAVAGGIHCRA